ncbi:MAG: hypothetical protein JWO94_681 [Verrucomicrobiaceae bacterium]|nr:hypothetical protein [Verrucomicrobiaceae bacterium]
MELGPGSPAVGTAVYALGYPCALPLKLSPGAEVKLLDDPERQKEMRRFHWFIANVDAYGGSSGSPVFNTKTHKVEGLLTGGFTTSDFAIIPFGANCNKSTIINDQHMGEAICDISVVGVAP